MEFDCHDDKKALCKDCTEQNANMVFRMFM